MPLFAAMLAGANGRITLINISFQRWNAFWTYNYLLGVVGFVESSEFFDRFIN